jgi:uncharacterized protein YjiK
LARARNLALLLAAAGFPGACRNDNDAIAGQLQEIRATRQKQLATRLGAAEANPGQPLARWIMPAELREISGITLLANGHLLAHDDEVGRIYEIDPKSGIILRRFALKGTPHGDFEGITTAGKDIYMVQSNGQIFRFEEARDGQESSYDSYDTRLGKECEFEGVAFEADSSWLLLPCKKVATKDLKRDLVIYRLSLPITSGSRLTMLAVPIADVAGSNGWKNLSPSDIAIDPSTGNYVLIAAQEKALVVITPLGQVVRSEALPPGHEQAEGVAITPDGILIVSDEATHNPADITLYRWRP